MATPRRNGRVLVLVLLIAAVVLAVIARFHRVRMVPETEPSSRAVVED